MNDDDKKALIAAIKKLDLELSKKIEDGEKNGLCLYQINEFIEEKEIQIEKISVEVEPLKALFNLIVGLNIKIDDLNQEINFLRSGFDPTKDYTR